MKKVKNIKIYGSSDDCICISGDMQDEGYVNGDGVGFVELNTGDVFRVEYTSEGVWRISRIQEGNPPVDCNLIACNYDEDNEEQSGYTDEMFMVGQITDIDFWAYWPPDYETLRDKIETMDNIRDCNEEQLWKIYKILKEAKNNP